MGLLKDENLNKRQQCALAAQNSNHTPGCIKGSMAGKLRGVIVALYFTLVRCPGVLYSALGPQHMKVMGLLKKVHRRVMKIKGLEHLPCDDKLRELGLLSLEKRRLVVAFQYLKRSYRKGGER